jgi:progressive ankylosis protein
LSAARGDTERTYGYILLFWLPLAAQWLMMSLEGPFLAAVIARLDDPVFNLAAYGVAFAFAILVEAPVIMLMSASIALVEDPASFRRMRNFAMALNAGVTGLLLLILIPPVYDGIMSGALGLPQPVTHLVYGSLWLLLPWPAAIGYRRFLHGVLIRSGRTRLVAYGTVLRLVAMSATAAALAILTALPGAWVGAAALSSGVCIEALATRMMAAPAIREVLGEPPAAGSVSGYGEIALFYFPLALTSTIALTVQPMLTFFMGRSTFPVESLAVFPVVHALSFLFRGPAMAYQETVIALVGRRFEHLRRLSRFGALLALGASGGLALVAFTPLADFWFQTVSGLEPQLAAFALEPTRILVPLPAVALLVAVQHALLVQGRRTRTITVATALEVLTIAALFIVVSRNFGLVGVSVAMVALTGGRVVGAAYMRLHVRRMLARPLPAPSSP